MDMNRVGTKSSFVCWYFFFLGFAVGNWISRLADIRDNNNLSYSLMGSILVCGALGALITLPFVTIIGKKYGSAICLLFGSLWLCVVMPLLGINGVGLPILYPAMFGVGIGLGFNDVGMTSQAILVEKDKHVNRMGFFQASMSIGAFVGAILGGAFSAFGVSPLINFLCICFMGFPFSVTCFFYLYDFENEGLINEAYESIHLPAPIASAIVLESTSSMIENSINTDNNTDTGTSIKVLTSTNTDVARPQPSDEHHYMLYLCIIGFCAQIGEGTISDWSTMYFADDLDASPMVSVTGYAAFSLMMAVGRVLGDSLGMKYGRMVLLKCSGTLAVIGLGIAILAPSLESSGAIVLAVLGLTLAGCGLSLCMPIVSSSAGDIPGLDPTDGVTTVISMSYLGFLLGPPFFGAMSDVLGSIRWSLLLCCIVLCFMVLCPGSPPLNKRHAMKESEKNNKDLENGRGIDMSCVVVTDDGL